DIHRACRREAIGYQRPTNVSHATPVHQLVRVSVHRLYFFFLIVWRPPGSTLFPYTTLFRSRRAFRCAGKYSRDVGAPDPCSDRGDRKSTRLNSSHVSISYAVFCLKKKKSAESELGENAYLRGSCAGVGRG